MTEPRPSNPPSTSRGPRRPDGPGDADTVGTGSAFAIGCTVLTLLGIFVGIAVFVLLTLV